jgi:DNA replication protein DnaC
MKINELDQPEDIIEALKEMIKTQKGFIIFSGKNGTGKSTSAMAVYEALCPYKLPAYDHDSAYFITQSDLNILWNKEFKEMGHCHHLSEDLKKTKLLILDDLGTRKPTDSFIDFLYEVMDKRYNFGDSKATIITTNLTISDMKKIFGDAFVSRTASGECFRLEGIDRRFKSVYSNRNSASLSQNEKKVSI